MYELLLTLDPTKSPSHDNINPRILKHCATAQAKPVTLNFSLSLQQCSFPSDLKHDKICPLPKKGDLHLVTNFRPFSLLPIISKVLETVVYNKVIDFIHPRLNQHQFGFLKNRSCSSQMLVFTGITTAIAWIKHQRQHYLSRFQKSFWLCPASYGILASQAVSGCDSSHISLIVSTSPLSKIAAPHLCQSCLVSLRAHFCSWSILITCHHLFLKMSTHFSLLMIPNLWNISNPDKANSPYSLA